LRRPARWRILAGGSAATAERRKAAVVGELLADRNGNGIPDVFEGMMAGAAQGSVVVAGGGASVQRVLSSQVVIVNGVVQQSSAIGPPIPAPPTVERQR
jgi:hypothetical protein